ncbi:MAG: 30S ribosome-binding factor RbfA [Phycisphaerales bacterium]|nr:30S ribosome-binding factor RbfA [Phycisphaerales bacterium]
MKARNSNHEDGSTSTRVARVESSICKAIQVSLARGLGDPRICGLVSVIGVDVSPDLSGARVRVSVVPEKYEPRVLSGLQSASGKLRGEIGHHARLRKVPRLTFEIDRSIKRQAELEALVRSEEPHLDPEAPMGDAPAIDKEANGT